MAMRIPSNQTSLWAPLVLGPIWAAGKGRWQAFWFGTCCELAGLSLLVQGFMTGKPVTAIAGLCFVAGLRVFAVKSARRWNGNGSIASLVIGTGLLAVIWAIVLGHITGVPMPSVLTSFPSSKSLTDSAVRWIESLVEAISDVFGPALGGLASAIGLSINACELLLVETPWPVVMAVTLFVSYAVGGLRTAIFSFGALSYLGIFGFWEKSMETLAMVAVSVLICASIGLPLGIAASRSRRLNAILDPILDTMQTMPSFVYLIPAVTFFSIGKPPGVIATVIFALPPIVRLTTLGLVQVPDHLREAAISFGSTRRQLLLYVELPLAVPSIMTGLNQSIMMSLSMVVVAALIGAGGLGTDVIRSLRNIETGNGVLVGFAIVACAMMLDRIVRGRRSK